MGLQTEKPKIRIIHNLARSGGTLISKCFASMDRIVLLSEIHPHSQHALSFNALKQAQDWYNIATDRDWQSTSFLEAIDIVSQYCIENEKFLILRDWSHVDFLGLPVTNTPENTSQLNSILTPHYDIHSVQVIRHPLDTWLSTRRLTLIKNANINEEVFLNAFQQYLKETSSNFQFIYEDFLNNPDAILSLACQALKIPFDDNYRNNWHEYTNITGDLSNSSSLRKKPTIAPRDRKPFNPIILDELKKHKSYSSIIEAISTYT